MFPRSLYAGTTIEISVCRFQQARCGFSKLTELDTQAIAQLAKLPLAENTMVSEIVRGLSRRLRREFTRNAEICYPCTAQSR